MKLDELLGVAAAKWPHNRALIFPESELTFSNLQANAERKARSLIGAGVRAGDHVGILSLNLPEYVESIFAISMSGATAVPVNARYRGAELQQVIADSDIRLLLTTSQFGDRIDFCAQLTDCYSDLSASVNPYALRIAEAPLLIFDRMLPDFGNLEIAPFILSLIIKTRLSPLEICGINF